MSSFTGPAIVYTPNIIASSLVQDLTSSQAQQATLENQLGTGDLVNQPSDNPAAASQILSLNAAITRARQYSTNAQDGVGWLSVGTSTLNPVLGALQQARQAVLSLSGNALSGQQAAVSGIAAQIGSDRQQIIGLANTKYNGQAIFAGTSQVQVAYDQNGNYLGNTAPPPGSPDPGVPTRTVAAGVEIPVAVTGDQIFGTNNGNTSPGAPIDLLSSQGILATLQSDISGGHLSTAETTDLKTLDAAISQVESQAAVMGANYQRMQGFAQQATDTKTALEQQLSSLDAVNVAKVTTQLTATQQSYQEALWATAQIQQQSLVQFLG